MTTVTLELPDRIVKDVERRAGERGLTFSQQVSELLERATKSDHTDQRSVAIQRMNELFAQVHGFDAKMRIPREELYER